MIEIADIIRQIFVFITGSAVGSFLNVCIYRLPKDVSIVKPSSFCPKCKTPIKWYDNIPVLSYIFLGAKCRNCQAKISLRYPVVEFITAVIFLVFYLKFKFTLFFFEYVFLFSLLIVVSLIDIDYRAIPIYFCFMGIFMGMVFSLGQSTAVIKEGVLSLKELPIVKSSVGLIVGFGFTYLFKFFGDIFVSFYLSWRKKESIEGEKESLGLGDVDFMGMVGVFLGWQKVILIFFIAPFFGLFYSIAAIIFKKSHVIPYLPYLSLATLVVFWWGDKILGFLFRG